MSEFDYRFSSRQEMANAAEEQFVLYGGAKGGGKSWWLCAWAFEQAVQYPGNRGFLGRKRGVDFNNTTLETWKKSIPAKFYKINEQKKRITIPAFDSYIDYGGLDSEEDVQKFNSAEYGFIGIDQAEEVSRDAFAMLRGTLRHKLKDGSEPSYLVRLTANPAQCWLKTAFIHNPERGFRFIKALPSDNPFLAKGYIDNLKEAFKHRPQLLQAYLYGSWDELAGTDIIIQSAWVEEAQKIKPHGEPIKRVVVCDPAHFGDDETVVYVLEQRSAICIVDTEVVNHKTLMDTAGRIMAKRKEWEANLIIIDSIGIGAGISDRLMELDENVIPFVSSKKPPLARHAERYFNLRAQMWMEGGRKIFEKLVALPKDDVLCGQLTMVHYDYISNGKFKVQPKSDLKKDFGRSPDRADALLMGLYGIELADRLDAEDEANIVEDRQGRGEIVRPNDGFSYCHDEF